MADGTTETRLLHFDSKADTILAMRHNLLGTAPRNWQTIDEVRASGYSGDLVIRSRRSDSKCWYNIGLDAWLRGPVKALELNPGDFYFNEPIDPRTVLLNGEICRSEQHYTLFCSRVQDHMRPALRAGGEHLFGLTALLTLRAFACHRGLHVIEELLDEFPDHIVEFTCLSKPYGTLGWRTVIWEVRNY